MSTPPSAAAVTPVRLGFFPNITHAPALILLDSGALEKALGGPGTLEPKSFNAGPAAVEALLSGALDATYIGPNPTLNAFARSRGEAVRVIAGTCSGGAALIVQPEINGPADLKGQTVSSPQLGGTQDVALRAWLKAQGFPVTATGQGEVKVLPQENAQILEAFRQKHLAGAWVPEPWATRLVKEGGGKVLVDERTLWPDGRFLTTNLIARTAWLNANPEAARKLIDAHLDALDLAVKSPADAQAAVNRGLKKLTGKEVAPALLTEAWRGLEFTADPLATTLERSAANAVEAGLLKPLSESGVTLSSLYDLSILNSALATRGQPALKVALAPAPPASASP